RVAEPQLSLGAPNPVELRIRDPYTRPLHVTVRDDVPAAFDVDRRYAEVDLAPGEETSIGYHVRPRHRGTFRFGDVHLRVRGPLRGGGGGAGVPRPARDPPVRDHPAARSRVRRGTAPRAYRRRWRGVRAPPRAPAGRRPALDLLEGDRQARAPDLRRVRDGASAARLRAPRRGPNDVEHRGGSHEARPRRQHGAGAVVRRARQG